MASVYIETTIPSYYSETRTALRILAWREITREWWDACRTRYGLVTSRFVLRELAAAPAPKAEQTLALLQDVAVLEEPPELADVIDFYVQHRLVPADAYGDAAHLAMASVHGVGFLLT